MVRDDSGTVLVSLALHPGRDVYFTWPDEFLMTRCPGLCLENFRHQHSVGLGRTPGQSYSSPRDPSRLWLRVCSLAHLGSEMEYAQAASPHWTAILVRVCACLPSHESDPALTNYPMLCFQKASTAPGPTWQRHQRLSRNRCGDSSEDSGLGT